VSAPPAWKWPGARWWRCDLHLHTPASEDVRERHAGSGEFTAEEVVAQGLGTGLDVIAVTDHDSGEWVDRVKAAANGTELSVVPGVEITTQERIHLLLLGDRTRTSADLDHLLSVLHILPADRGLKCARSDLNYEKAMDVATELGWLCIAPHADVEATEANPSRGALWTALHTSDKGRLNQILDRPDLVAAELVGNDPDVKAELRGAGRAGRLRREPGLAVVRFSDAHHLDDMGRSSTWIKMTHPDREGLALAFSDGDRSVRVHADGLELNRPSARVIKQIMIRDLKYAGRGAPLEIPFNPWLNVLIGGRGAGKSTIVNVLRLALGRADEAVTEDFKRFNQVGSREGDGALTDETLLAVDYRRDAHDLRASWSIDGTAPPLQEPEGDGWVRVDGVVSQRTPVRVVGQGELALLAEDPRRLLGLVDAAPEVDRRGWQRTWNATHAQFLTSRAQAREARTRIPDRAELLGEQTDLQRAIAVLESDEHRDALRAYQRLRRQLAALDSWGRSVAQTVEQVRTALDDAAIDDPPLSAFDDDGVDAEVRGVLARAHADLRGALDRARRAGADLPVSAAKLPPSWDAHRREVERRYQELAQRLSGTGADPSQYADLITRRQSVEARLKGVNGLEAEADRLDTEAADALERLAGLGQELYGRRRAFLDTVNASADIVRFALDVAGERESNTGELRELLLGSAEGDSMQADIVRCGEIITREADGLAGAKALKVVIRRAASGDVSEFGGWFQRRLAQIKPETLDRLDAWFPADRLRADYRNAAQEWQPISQGSAGQRNAAILAFLLSYGDEPLVIDQPENDLDNALITDLVVRQLRDIRQRRQLIVVTHNPNIVVNADADLVMSMKFANGQVVVAKSGGLQEQDIREEICRIVEGGREAFESRYARIGERHV